MSIEGGSSLAETFKTIEPHRLGHLALLPSNEEGTAFNDVVVRRYPARHHHATSLTPAEAQKRIDDATEHFEILRQTDIHVPSVYMAHENPDGPYSGIISIVEAAIGEDITHSGKWPKQNPGSGHHDQVLGLSASLVKYYRWVLEVQPNTASFLSDLDDLKQYKIMADGRIALVDTDPLMLDTRGIVGAIRLRDSLGRVNGWLDSLQLGQSADKLAHKEQTQEIIKNLMACCTRRLTL